MRASTTIAAAVMLMPATAFAQEYCVACTEPSALYRCIIDNARPGVASSLQVVCINRIATEGGHGQCAVRRGVTVFECDGIVKRISMANDAPPATAGAPPSAPAPAAPVGTHAAPKSAPEVADPNEPPKTVAEMAKRAKAGNDRQMKEAGSFFKKTLGCIASLFTKCGSDE